MEDMLGDIESSDTSRESGDTSLLLHTGRRHVLSEAENSTAHTPTRTASELKKRHLIGVACLLFVVCLWVGSSDLSQFIFQDLDYSKPFFLTYFDTSMFALYMLGFLISPNWRKTPWSTSKGDHAKEKGKLGIRETIILSVQFGVLWFAANYTFNAALISTSIASNTIISSLSGLATLILGTLCKVDHFTLLKFFAVVVSFAGVTLVAFSDQTSADTEGDTGHKDSIWGDVLSFASAGLYGCYIVFLKVKVSDESRINMPMFFGFLGFVNMVTLLPVLLLLDWTGLERLEVPDPDLWGFLLLNAVLGTVLSDYLWLWSMLLTSPLVCTLGLSLSIPVAMLSDWLLGNAQQGYSLIYVCGAVLVICGFLAVNAPERIQKKFTLSRKRSINAQPPSS